MIAQTLKDLLKALKGLVVMSSQLELMASSLYNNTVPEMWNAKVHALANPATCRSSPKPGERVIDHHSWPGLPHMELALSYFSGVEMSPAQCSSRLFPAPGWMSP